MRDGDEGRRAKRAEVNTLGVSTETLGVTDVSRPVSAARTRRMVRAWSLGMFCKDTERLWRLYPSQHHSIYATRYDESRGNLLWCYFVC